MKSDTKFFVGVVVLALLALGAILFFNGRGKNQTVVVGTQDGQKLGPDSAKVKIVEFGDMQCPACAAAAPDLKKAQQADPDNVQVIFRFFPLSIHANAQISAQAAAAAGLQGKFWQLNELLFANQGDWQSLSDPTDQFLIYIRQLSLDESKFKADLNSEAVKKLVKDDLDYGNQIGIDRTPTFFINDKKLEGAQSLEQWQKLIEQAKAS